MLERSLASLADMTERKGAAQADLTERKNSAGEGRSALVLFNPSQPPPLFVPPPPTRMTHKKQPPLFAVGQPQFSTPPPGFSTGIPQLDDVVRQIGDTKEDRLLAPWTASRSWNFTRPRFNTTFNLPSSMVATSGTTIPLYKVVHPDAKLLFNLELDDDDSAVKAKGVHMKRVPPLIEHLATAAHADVEQLINTDGLLDLPLSRFANFEKSKLPKSEEKDGSNSGPCLDNLLDLEREPRLRLYERSSPLLI